MWVVEGIAPRRDKTRKGERMGVPVPIGKNGSTQDVLALSSLLWEPKRCFLPMCHCWDVPFLHNSSEIIEINRSPSWVVPMF
ncbi:MAG: hypothetical protein D6704_00570 [Nitrospirae bacterium]|nr:MAG: hypothetical protein D6704_00570 [Nitrospirota bacterium]